MNKQTANLQNDSFWHLRTIEEVEKELKTTSQGLTIKQSEQRNEKFGDNTLEGDSDFKGYKVLLEKINSLLIYILFGASIIAFLTHEILEGVIILGIIFMTVTLGFFQEYKADKTIKALSKLSAKKITVKRNGKKVTIDSAKLVPGDIVYLNRGDIVPADIRLFEVSGLEINESIITGESLDRRKTTNHISDENVSLGDMTNMAFSSTHVTGGQGVGIVVEIGRKTFIGQISESIEKIAIQKSPIQKKIDLMSKRISYIVLSVAFLLFLLLLFQGNSLYFSILLISAVAIAGIPESFPLALTLTFSHGIKKMAKQNAIVKDLNSVETLGTTTVICTDKTGTLTQNNMRVTSFLLSDKEKFTAKGKGYEPHNTFYKKNSEIDNKQFSKYVEFFKAAILCNDAEIEKKQGEWKLQGEPTEGALLAFGKSANHDENALREDFKRIDVVPFDPKKKFMISIHQNIDDKKNIKAYIKGAGEIVLKKCQWFRDSNNSLKKITPQYRKEIFQEIEKANSKGLRVLSLGSKKITLDAKSKYDSQVEGQFIFEGFVGIEDPIRDEVLDAVEECKKAGIKTVMITGDHKLIAKSIGEKLQIFQDHNTILEGHEIDNLTDDELDEVIDKTAIFARTTPEHKLRIVSSFQRKGEIVAMTGDGVNDAPALKKADIGISMGKNGTEVAREASNMILTDDNFATIVQAVKEGRTVYSNIRRFIYYLLTGNFTEVALITLAVLISSPLPLTALMILFINIVTSTIPALALSVEPTHKKVMNQIPRKPKERLLSKYILTKILITIPILLAGTMGIFLWELNVNQVDLQLASTVAFATLITFELFHTFNARSLHTSVFNKNFLKNKAVFVSIFISFTLMLLAIYTQIGQNIFETQPLTIQHWITIIAIGSIIVLFTELTKLSTKVEFEEQNSLRGLKYHFE